MADAGYNRPQKRRIRRRIIASALVLISLFSLISARQEQSALASGRLSADDLSIKIMRVFAAPVRGLETLLTRASDKQGAYERNIELTAEVNRLRPFEDRVLDMEMRMRKYEAILSIDNSSDIPAEKIVVRAVNETNGPFTHSALINGGRSKGIKVGHAVMSIDGLYGHVVRTGTSSARVLLLKDINSRVSVMSQRSESRAILVGNASAAPKLEYISPDADWQDGDRVVTSGDDGVLPRGLVIGTAMPMQGGRYGVDIFTDRNPVDWVWVYPFTPILAPDQDGLGPEETTTEEPINIEPTGTNQGGSGE